MNPLQELALHVAALDAAVDANPKFFAAVIHYVRRLKQLLTGAGGPPTREELWLLSERLEEFWAKWRSSGEGFYIPPRETADTDSTVRQVHSLARKLSSLDEASFQQLLKQSGATISGENKARSEPLGQSCVFLGHGRSRLWARVKMFLEDELGLATVTYESEPRTGESIVPVLERMLDQATFAVLVLTAEDETHEGVWHARQNVVHEAGLFQGRLGFKRAVLLVQDGVEPFSNVHGLQHIPFAGENVEQTFYELERVLKRERQLSR
jgi:predicted nucleotide-binding protein